MPKPSQGIATSEGSMRLEISCFIKHSLIRACIESQNYLSWNNGSSISYYTKFKEDEKYLRLVYTQTDYQGIRNKMDYKINLIGIKSNLGKGIVYYFECPVSFRKCRVLYLAYRSQYFKSRFAYRNRIYYECQRCSKRDFAHTRYFKFKDKYDKLIKENYRESYRGKKTRSLKRLEHLESQYMYYDFGRWKQFEFFLKRKGYL